MIEVARMQAVTLQFHPDWPHAGGKVIESMAADGAYRSQFTTGISNGGLTAFLAGIDGAGRVGFSPAGMTRGSRPTVRSTVRGTVELTPTAERSGSDRRTSD